MTFQEWHDRGVKLFGEDKEKWAFVCPSCGHVATVQDWHDAGAPTGSVAYSCVGRWKEKPSDAFQNSGPCNYAGGGLFKLNPVDVDGVFYFDFAPSKEAE